jgi:tRNA threonylcarbamoyl adenosine modification protein (Sua5/YciO/YrdC/YwlC family)
MTLRYDCSTVKERTRALKAATSAVRRGDLVVFPTDSAYGVGTDAFSPTGVAGLRRAKGRGRELPLPVLIGSPQTLSGIAAKVGDSARRLIEDFWPGPLTLVVRAQPTLTWDIPDNGVISVRMPLHPLAIDLLRQAGPMVVTGANAPGEPLPRTCGEAERQLGNAIGMFLDAGELAPMDTSSIIDVTGKQPILLREGGYPASVLRESCPGLVIPGADAPGA